MRRGNGEDWDDKFFPHAPMVGKSHFPSLLIKCVWYASGKGCLCANVKSVMWGVGAKGNSVAWWRGAHAKAEW